MPELSKSDTKSGTVMQLPIELPGEEIIITGISGVFAESDSVQELSEKLFNKEDLITSDERRWKYFHPEVPQRGGRLKDISRFDNKFFNIKPHEADSMDPMLRIVMEKAYEAILDAGYHPSEFKGTNTGVYAATCFTETENAWFYEKPTINGSAITGCSRSLLSGRLSYVLDLHGPSCTFDTACSSSSFALQQAYAAIRYGYCDAAIVAASNLALHPFLTLSFAKLGVLSPDGTCKSFDNSADGYVRSESITVCILQRAKNARRAYSQLVHCKTNCDGFKEHGITYPSSQLQKELMSDFYEECGVHPSELEFIEAHGTGTKIGDPEELNAIDQALCSKRTKPLLIGSVKSNLGHAEPASGLISIAKILIAYQTGLIPPNINFTRSREGIAALDDGRLQVVTEPTPWNRGYAGINNFGFGGANAHCLLKNVARAKINKGIPRDDLPRLVCISGRVAESVSNVLDDIESRPLDADYVALWHWNQRIHTPNHYYRGYSILKHQNGRTIQIRRHICRVDSDPTVASFIFSGVGSQSRTVGRSLCRIQVFRATIERCNKALASKNVDLIQIISEGSVNHVMTGIISTVAIQIALFETMKMIAIVPDTIIGHGLGELAAAYADGCLTLEQTMLAAYSVAQALLQVQSAKGCMVEVNLGHEQLKEICPKEISIAHHNGEDSTTVSAPIEHMIQFLSKLVSMNVKAKEVSCYDIAFHTMHLAKAGTQMIQSLREVIPMPKARSNKWISTSRSKTQAASAEYFVDCLMNPVHFEEAMKLVHFNNVTVELAPRCHLVGSVKNSLREKREHVQLSAREHDQARPGHDAVNELLDAIGKLFEKGLNPHLANIYPKVNFPVAVGTPMLSHLIKWDHKKKWAVAMYNCQKQWDKGEKIFKVALEDAEYEFISGHVIDGRNLFPATGYLFLVWYTYSLIKSTMVNNQSVVFEDINFLRATNIAREANIVFTVALRKSSGYFEIVENNTTIVTGKISELKRIPGAAENQGSTRIPPVTKDEICLNSKDFYKELRLRGYNYSGAFRGVIYSNVKGNQGQLAWKHNWVTFLDTMMQMSIMMKDSRGLFVPTRVERISIDTDKHFKDMPQMSAVDAEFPLDVTIDEDLGNITAGGVEMCGVHATAISKRHSSGEPVLEKYEFIPHCGKECMKIEDIIRFNIQLILENIQVIKVKAIEVFDAAAHEFSKETVAGFVRDVLGDLPLVHADVFVYSTEPMEAPPGVTVEVKQLTEEMGALFIIGTNLLNREVELKKALKAVRDEKCFVISRESSHPDSNNCPFLGNLDIITVTNSGSQYFVMFRKRLVHKAAKFIHVDMEDGKFDWLETVKKEVAECNKLVLVSQNDQLNGVVGLVNCLRKEPGGEVVSCVFIPDNNAPNFHQDLALYKQELDKDLAINVYKDGEWGSYRHLRLQELDEVLVERAYVNVGSRGDLSTLRWMEAPAITAQHARQAVVNIYYSALNFRDIMTATGRLSVETVAKGRLAQDCVQGLEFCGRTDSGERVMGIASTGALANMILADKDLLWSVPDHWTLEEACTVPIVYGTVLYAFHTTGGLKPGSTVLIHAGSGGVGQAAIHICLHHKCTVFTTVGTNEKRKFIKKTFPQIKESHIGNSRDVSFEEMIMIETQGRGVDVVLNSLSEEKLMASLRCVGYKGRFLEIGKFDFENNSALGMDYFSKERTFHGILLDNLIDHATGGERQLLQKLLYDAIDNGSVKPLCRSCFKSEEIEQAFRFMATGKHIGKVLVKIRDEEEQKLVKPQYMKVPAVPRYTCNDQMTYILVGGLGGFGLELADQLVLRGARRLVLNSRRGVSNGYQASRIQTWESYGVMVEISRDDVTKEAGCEAMLRAAIKLGPVCAIFNLAVVLQDALLENQTVETFATSFAPKADATKHLDRLSRKLCPDLREFVVFSSVSCGRGNAGQSNYGAANSVMERACERRRRLGLPALAVQWGAIGEVGLVADMQEEHMELEIGGTLQQSIASCLRVLDQLLKQDAAVVSSMVVAEKKGPAAGTGNIVDTIAAIMGIKDLKTVAQTAPLSELGMDSMTAVEIKQCLERDFEIFLSAQEIRSLTFGRLMELSALQNEELEASLVEGGAGSGSGAGNTMAGLHLLLRNMGNESLVTQDVVYPPTAIQEGSDARALMFMTPGIEGMASALEGLAGRMKARVAVLQLGTGQHNDSVKHTADTLAQMVKEREPEGTRQPFILLGYSYGVQVTLELASILESEGRTGIIFCVDGAPKFMHKLLKSIIDVSDEVQTQNSLILYLAQLAGVSDQDKIRAEVLEAATWDEKTNLLIKYAPKEGNLSANYQKTVATVVYSRLGAINRYKEGSMKKLKSHIVLLRTKDTPFAIEIEQDYALSNFTEHKVEVHSLEANHATIVENVECANIINKTIHAMLENCQ